MKNVAMISGQVESELKTIFDSSGILKFKDKFNNLMSLFVKYH